MTSQMKFTPSSLMVMALLLIIELTSAKMVITYTRAHWAPWTDHATITITEHTIRPGDGDKVTVSLALSYRVEEFGTGNKNLREIIKVGPAIFSWLGDGKSFEFSVVMDTKEDFSKKWDLLAKVPDDTKKEFMDASEEYGQVGPLPAKPGEMPKRSPTQEAKKIELENHLAIMGKDISTGAVKDTTGPAEILGYCVVLFNPQAIDLINKIRKTLINAWKYDTPGRIEWCSYETGIIDKVKPMIRDGLLANRLRSMNLVKPVTKGTEPDKPLFEANSFSFKSSKFHLHNRKSLSS